MASEDAPGKYHRWRLIVGDRPGLRRRRWPAGMVGAGVTEVPDRPGARPGPGPGDWVTQTMVVAQSVEWLRYLLEHPSSLLRTRKLLVVVEDWRVPQRGWSGRLGPLRHLERQWIRLPRGGEGRAVLELEVRWSMPLRTLLSAVVPVLTPVLPVPHPASADVTAQGVLPAWLGVNANLDTITGPLPDNRDIRPHDLVLTATGEPQPLASPAEAAQAAADAATAGVVAATADDAGASTDPADWYAATVAGRPQGAGLAGRPATVVTDLTRTVVRNRYGPFGAAAGRAELVFTGAEDGRGFRLTGPARVLAAGRIDRPWFDAGVREALEEIGTVHCREVPARNPLEEAAFLVQLVLAGLLVHVPGLPDAVGAHLSDEVRDGLRADLPEPGAEDLDWEIRTVALRRAAMRLHGSGFVLPRLAGSAFPALTAPPSVSALLVTKRIEHVIEVVDAIEAQTYPNLEIVLCMHGVELPKELRARIARGNRPVEIVTLPAEHGFGEAIGVATGRARGSLVTKFDDDDTYGPEHVWDLVLARHYSGATLVGKGAEFVYLQSLGTTVRRTVGLTESYVNVVAGGTMLMGRGDLEEVGGWRPVPRSIDRGLIDRVRRAGGLIYRTHPLGYVYHRRSDGHTWDPGLEYFLRGAGMQWSGLPRRREFGTDGGLVGPAGEPEVDSWLAAGTGRALATGGDR